MRSLWTLREFFKPFWRIMVALGVVGLIAGGMVGLVFTKLKPVLEQIFQTLPSVGESPARDAQMHALYESCEKLLAVLVITALAEGLAYYLGEMLGQRVLALLRGRVFSHLQSLSMSFFENRRSGELMSRVSNDTTVLQRSIGTNLQQLVVAPATALVLIGKMVQQSWRLTVFMVVMMPLVVLVTSRLGRRVRRYATRVQMKVADLTAAMQESFTAMRVVKIFGMEPRMIDRFQNENRGVYRAEMRSARMHAANMPLVGTMLGAALCGALLFGAGEIMAGRIDGAGLLAFVAMMQGAASQVNRASRVFLGLQQAEAAAARIVSLLNEPQEIADSPDAAPLIAARGHVVFDDVAFSYDGERHVLEDFSLEIKPGEVVALAGPSGSGKTTVANLLARLYDVQGGAISIDGMDVRAVTQESLRSHMGIVPQETILFSASIGDNIGYGRPGAIQAEIRAAAQAANAAGFIDELPEGYETLVGERGAKLSGGQRQRIAIARAFLRDPRILILDEATSSLDRESEAAVHRALATLLEGRTALIIAHRLSTIRNADRIVVMDRGRIVEQGTHDELLTRDGLYRRLYESAEQAEVGQPL